MPVIQFPGHHHERPLEDEKCLVCEIFALIARDFPDIETTPILHALVECLATVVYVSAKPDQEEAFAHEVANDVEHVTLQLKLFGDPHRPY
jgi:hypothetical protein